MMNPMLLSNVSPKNMRGDKSLYQIPQPLREVVYALATANPTWEFIGESEGHDNNRMDKFRVRSEDQIIGGLKMDWSSRSGQYAVCVLAEGITARNSHMTTVDTKKAIRTAQKHFVPKSMADIMKDEKELANRIIENQRYRKGQRVNDYMSNIKPNIIKFALRIDRERFTDWMESLGKHKELEEYDNSKAELKVMETIQDKAKNEGVYISLYKGGYLVKHLDNVQHYNDTTLPMEYRAKLGMLKLVEKEQCIEGVGCKANETLYVLIPE
jgi:hypothetical protein